MAQQQQQQQNRNNSDNSDKNSSSSNRRCSQWLPPKVALELENVRRGGPAAGRRLTCRAPHGSDFEPNFCGESGREPEMDPKFRTHPRLGFSEKYIEPKVGSFYYA
jgi:hypothetical protein